MKNDQIGAINGLIVSLISTIVLLLGSAGFGVWAYLERQDYKNNSDAKAKQASETTAKRVASEKDNEFVEREKEPYKQYAGPSDLGSVAFSYPKTWSGHATIKGSESNFVFHPNVVSGDQGAVHALRITISQRKYSEVVKEFNSDIKQGKARATVYRLPKINNVTGVRIDGQYDENKNGSVIILPLRDKTIKIAAESKDFIGDLNKIILPSFSYSP
jgi:hypothetical protein